MWNLLTNNDIHNIYGSYVWKLFPKNWRRWWINTLPQVPCFHNVTIEYPPSLLVDKTSDLEEFNEDIATGILATIAKTINKHLMPTIYVHGDVLHICVNLARLNWISYCRDF